MHIALGILAIAAVVVLVTALAERIRFSAPLLLMLVGIGASYIPGLEPPTLTPNLVLLGFLPPLLYAAAIRTSVIDFRANRRSIGTLSVVLVVLTALGVGWITWMILDVPFAVAFALGAVVAPPDAVAATAIARSVGLPRRLVTILEGESLVNDATAITCLRVAIAAISGAVGVGQVTVGFLIAAVGGAGVGLAVATIAVQIRKRITQPVFDTAISLMLPFAAYLPAEEIHWDDYHGSGVIAVVVAGLVLGHKSPIIQSGQSRLSERVNWATIQFVLENTVFLLIGLQADRIVGELEGSDLGPGRIAWFCGAVLAGVIGIRLLWVTAARFILFRRGRGPEDGRPPSWGSIFVVGWAGLRGVVTLAAAFLLPPTVPHRDILIFAAMVVTAGTLLLQGLTLPLLVRRLGLRGPDPRSDALQAATVLQTASNAALEALDRVKRPTDSEETLTMLRERIRARPDALWERLGSTSDVETPAEEYRRLRLQTLAAERDEVLRVRKTGTVDHDVIENVLASLDIEESMLTIATERSDRLAEDDPVETPRTATNCVHLMAAPVEVESSGSDVCEDCVREGTRTVHLRICLVCGNVGCCDSSTGRHAERHFQTTHHPVMLSYEPGESWRWCYLDEQLG